MLLQAAAPIVQTDATAMLTASAISVYLIQRLKSASWFKLLTPNTKYLNIAASLFAAAIAATGIHYTFDPNAGTLTITGLTIAGILTALWTWAKSFALNELIYQGTIGAPYKTAAAAQLAVQTAVQAKEIGLPKQQSPGGLGTK
jgi:hypothetical protein